LGSSFAGDKRVEQMSVTETHHAFALQLSQNGRALVMLNFSDDENANGYFTSAITLKP
jgi:hypothetical protein